MLQAELITLLEKLAPTHVAQSWDNSGVQVASTRVDINHMAIMLDPSPKSVEQAVALGADFILSHHPLSMSPQYPNKLNAYHRVLSLLMQNNVTLFSAHTSLDSMEDARWLALELGLKNIEILEPYAENPEVGIACIGVLEDGFELESSEFIEKISTLIPHTAPFIKMGSMPKKIKRVAMCPGSGTSLALKAQKMGADIFITGDVKYHTALDFSQSYYSTEPFCIIDVGHHSLEEEMMKRFSKKITGFVGDMHVSFVPSQDPFSLITE